MPLLTAASADQLAERDAQRAMEVDQSRPVDELAGYVLAAFQDAERHKAGTITPRLLDCDRRRQRQYDPDVLAAIQESGGSETFYGLTNQKVAGFLSWLTDVLRSEEQPWELQPTPVPELPDPIRQEIVQRTMAYWGPVIQAGEQWAPEDVSRYARTMHDGMFGDLQKEARDRVRRMEDRIADLLQEGAYWSALDEFLDSFSVYPTAFLKGPLLEIQRRVVFAESTNADGKPTMVAELQDVPTNVWHNVSPFDLYVSPSARSIDDGYVIERCWYDGSQLEAMAKLEGYSAEAIRRVIAEGTGPVPADSAQAERAILESRDTLAELEHNKPFAERFQALEFWGAVPADRLREWDIDTGDALYVDCCVVVVGKTAIRAVINPDPLGLRPYYAASYMPVPGSIWGQALPEVMADCQDAYNRAMRACDNNLALASGPQVAVDITLLPPEFDYRIMRPWRVWPMNGSRSADGKVPVSFFQPTILADQLLSVAKYHDERADNVTGIPRYISGDPNARGAAETMGGLSMLLGAAAKGLRRALAQVDAHVLQPSLTRLYRWLMTYGDDDDIKGDAQVVARGALYNLIRDQHMQRTQQFAALTANPIDMQILGMPGRAKLLRAIAAQLNISEHDLIPKEEELEARQMATQAAQAQAQQQVSMQGQAPGAPKPPTPEARPQQPGGPPQ